MASIVVWAILIGVAVLLGLAARNFSLSSVRWVSAITAVILVCAITKYGVDLWLQAHSNTPPSNLVNAFTSGADALIKAFLRPLLLGYQGSPPGPIGRGVAVLLLLVGYRALEWSTMQRQAPQLNSTTLSGGQPSTAPAGAPASAAGGGVGDTKYAREHAQLAAELRFRLAAIEVRAPAILPGGSRTSGLASIAETSGVSGAGMAGAIIRFVSSIWPNPRQLLLRVWVEPKQPVTPKASPAKSDCKVTVYLENPRNGETVVTETLAGSDVNEAASMVAGFVARQVFIRDPATPPWCYGRADGGDLGALLLARLERVHTETSLGRADSRRAQIRTLRPWATTGTSAGVVRYELAQLLDLDGDHIGALGLHAMNLEQCPRFYRGRYRLGMSLEMITNPELKFRDKEETSRQLKEILGILNRKVAGSAPDRQPEYLESCDGDERLWRLTPSLRLVLLTTAAQVLREVRQQLTLRNVVWSTIRHRNERPVWLPYWTWLPEWGLRRRWAFHDGVSVAELLVAIRIKLLESEISGKGSHDNLPPAFLDATALVNNNLGHYAGGIKIASAIAGEHEAIRRVLSGDDGRHRAWRLPHRRARASWQAAYNAACLYAALVRQKPEMASQEHVVACLRSAVENPRSEIDRAFDWVSRDPDLCFLDTRRDRHRDPPRTAFEEFLDTQERLDYPADFPSAPRGAPVLSPDIPRADATARSA